MDIKLHCTFEEFKTLEGILFKQEYKYKPSWNSLEVTADAAGAYKYEVVYNPLTSNYVIVTA
jgi:hypothetical protein